MNRKLEEVFKVRDQVIYSVTGDTKLKDAVDKMNQHSIGALMVISEQGDIEGLLSERDVMRKLASTYDLVGHLPVREIMTPKEKLVIAEGDETIAEIMELMVDKKIRHLPIIDSNGVLHGLISMRDIILILLHDAEQDAKDMKDYVMGKYPT